MSKTYRMLILLSFFIVFLLTFRVHYNNIRLTEITSKAEQDNATVVREMKQEIKEAATEIKADIDKIEKKIVKNENDQRLVDKSQDSKIDANTSTIVSNSIEISGMNSNITNNIEPQMLTFDGNFKSLESVVNMNKANIESLANDITTVTTEQISWNEQFSNQQSDLQKEILKVQERDYQDQIDQLKTTMNDSIIPDVNVNKQGIANVSKKIDSDLTNDLEDLTSKYMSLSENTNALGNETLRLAEIVDTHDMVLKS